MPRGRQTKLTAALAEKVYRMLRAGGYRSDAALAAGVSLTTLRRWLRTGKQARSGLHRDFWTGVLEAEVEAKLTYVEAVNGILTDPDAKPADRLKAACWWLERKHPEQWGSHSKEIRDLQKQIEELKKLMGGNNVAHDSPAVDRTGNAGNAAPSA